MTKHEKLVHDFANAKGGTVEKLGKAFFVTYALSLAMWTHRTKRPSYYLKFDTAEQMQDWIEIKKRSITLEMNQSNRFAEEARKKSDGIVVGSVLYDSWGWEQTNIDFYVVVKKTDSSAWLQKVGNQTTETSFMSGTTVPVLDKRVGEVFVRRIGKFGIKITDGSGTLTLWDNEPKSCSWYA